MNNVINNSIKIPKNIFENSNLKNEKNENFDEYNLEFYPKYNLDNIKVLEEKKLPGDKIFKVYENGAKEINFPSGVKKQIFDDGYTIIYFNNGDIKQIFPEKKTIYFFYSRNTVQTILNNGIKIINPKNGKIEKIYPEGNKEIIYYNGQKNILNPKNQNTLIINNNINENNNILEDNGIKIISSPNGGEIYEFSN